MEGTGRGRKRGKREKKKHHEKIKCFYHDRRTGHSPVVKPFLSLSACLSLGPSFLPSSARQPALSLFLQFVEVLGRDRARICPLRSCVALSTHVHSIHHSTDDLPPGKGPLGALHSFLSVSSKQFSLN